MNYQFHINDFEGPLDLLLHLIRINEMDIYDINISSITEQYIEFINKMKESDINIAGEYLLMASELIHIKSKNLISEDKEEEENSDFDINTKEELTKRLLEYQTIKSLTSTFQELSEKRNEIYTKLPSNLSEYKEENVIGQGNIDDLIQAFQLFLERQKYAKPIKTKVTRKELSVEDRIKSIRSFLKKERKINFFDLFDQINKSYVVVTFLSILEMTKNNEIILTQTSGFSPLIIEMK